MGRDANSGTASETTATSTDEAQQQAAQSQPFPDVIGDSEAYMNQGDDDELLANNGLGDIPLSLAIIGSGFVVPPFGGPFIAPPFYYNTMRPAVIRPPLTYSPPPVIVMRHYNPPTVFKEFQSPFSNNVSPFAAGPSPAFPATGGAFPHTFHSDFGSFHSAFGGFHPSFGGFHGGFGGGFGHGGGFGGHR